MVSMRSVVRAVTLSVALLVFTASSPASARKTLNEFDNADLLDLLDAELDESFLVKAAPRGMNAARFLQGESMTFAPTSTPTSPQGSQTPAPMVSDRGSGTSAPTTSDLDVTSAPTTSERGLETSAPTVSEPPDVTNAPVTSGVWRPVPSAALAFAAVVLAALSGGAFAA